MRVGRPTSLPKAVRSNCGKQRFNRIIAKPFIRFDEMVKLIDQNLAVNLFEKTHIFLGREQDMRFFKEIDTLNPDDCYQKLMDPDPAVHLPMAQELMHYQKITADDRLALSHTRALVHYIIHNCFLEPNQVLSHMDQIAHLPAIIIHGDADTVCHPDQARLLHQNWPGSTLWIIKDAGHSADDPAIADALSAAVACLK